MKMWIEQNVWKPFHKYLLLLLVVVIILLMKIITCYNLHIAMLFVV